MHPKIFPSTMSATLPGPMRTFANVPTYTPVDCDFTDDLEYASIKRIVVDVKHWSSAGVLATSRGLIADIETRNKEEHLILSNGDRVRLDYIFELSAISESSGGIA